MSVRTGGCLCGAVRYAVEGEMAPIQLCYCSQCRKAQGGPFGANSPVATAAFRLVSGGEALREYRASPGKRRVFCEACGSPIFSQRDDMPDVLRVRAGTLDQTEGLQIGQHRQTASKAAWWAIPDDGLPQDLD